MNMIFTEDSKDVCHSLTDTIVAICGTFNIDDIVDIIYTVITVVLFPEASWLQYSFNQDYLNQGPSSGKMITLVQNPI